MKILFLEPFFGGSHKDFAKGFMKHSKHDVDLISLPARFWKWRMRGAALHFLVRTRSIGEYDAVFATDMMDLTDFIGLHQNNMPPVLLYFHENQLSYPISPGEQRDFHLGFTNIISAAAADRVMFNSHFHYNEFMKDAKALIRKLPDYRPEGMLEDIHAKSEVAYPGCRFDQGDVEIGEKRADPPLVIWNHRWEHDKNPDSFFNALECLKKENVPFSLAVLGENFEKSPPVFFKAKEQLNNNIRAFGFIESRQEYVSWLKKGAIVVSCANQENFGISVVEAVRYGCLPLLPDRLSYPELIPEKYHHQVIYKTQADLVNKLKDMLINYVSFKPLQTDLSGEMERFAWSVRIKQYDNAIQKMRNSS